MGNIPNSDAPNFDELYKKEGLEIPDEKFYTCEFERKFLMVINLYRKYP